MECGSEYPADYASTRCAGEAKSGACGGLVPSPAAHPSPGCLICLDRGEVELVDKTTRKCPRGCALQHAENSILSGAS
jgi:hypothetical protein